jgi:hypothetical protein
MEITEAISERRCDRVAYGRGNNDQASGGPSDQLNEAGVRCDGESSVGIDQAVSFRRSSTRARVIHPHQDNPRTILPAAGCAPGATGQNGGAHRFSIRPDPRQGEPLALPQGYQQLTPAVHAPEVITTVN